jgi:hypothetical protein
MITERLSEYHNEQDLLENELDSTSFKNSTKFKFRHSLRYLSQFLILFTVGVIFFTVNTFVFYQDIQNYLAYRPIIVSMRQLRLTELCFYTIENECTGGSLSLIEIYPNNTVFGDTITIYNNVIADMNSILSIYKDQNVLKLMSGTLQQYIYYQIPNVTTFLQYGAYTGTNFVQRESLFIVFNGISDSIPVLLEFLANVADLNSIFEKINKMENDDSKFIIDTKLNNLIYFTAGCCIFLLLLHFVLYCPMFVTEIRVLRRITEILKIIPTKPIAFNADIKEKISENIYAI